MNRLKVAIGLMAVAILFISASAILTTISENQISPVVIHHGQDNNTTTPSIVNKTNSINSTTKTNTIVKTNTTTKTPTIQPVVKTNPTPQSTPTTQSPTVVQQQTSPSIVQQQTKQQVVTIPAKPWPSSIAFVSQPSGMNFGQLYTFQIRLMVQNYNPDGTLTPWYYAPNTQIVWYMTNQASQTTITDSAGLSSATFVCPTMLGSAPVQVTAQFVGNSGYKAAAVSTDIQTYPPISIPPPASSTVTNIDPEIDDTVNISDNVTIQVCNQTTGECYTEYGS